MLVVLMKPNRIHTSVNSGRQHIMLSLLLACVMFKALIPQGYMPGNIGAGEGVLVFCGLDLLSDSENILPNTNDSHEQFYDSDHANLCLFSALGGVNVNVASLSKLFYLLAKTPLAGYDPPLSIRKPRFIQTGPRAPPVLS